MTKKTKRKPKTALTLYHWERVKPGGFRIVTTMSAVIAAYQYARRQREETGNKSPVFKSEKLTSGNWRVTRSV